MGLATISERSAALTTQLPQWLGTTGVGAFLVFVVKRFVRIAPIEFSVSDTKAAATIADLRKENSELTKQNYELRVRLAHYETENR